MRSTRDAYVIAAWQACDKPCSPEKWAAIWEDWEVLPVDVEGVPAGAVFANGPEVHVAILPKYRRRWLTPSLWRSVFVDRANRYGFVTTKVARSRSDSFVRRCGFVPVSDGDPVEYVRYADA